MSVGTTDVRTTAGARRGPAASGAITVLLPVRDAERTVARALRSTLVALRADDRVLVLDDASSDGTWSVLESVRASDDRVRTSRSAVHRGVAESLNVLLGEAGTELVARMDADDLVLPWRFELQRRALRRHGDDVVFATVVHRRLGTWRLKPQLPTGIRPSAVPLSLVLGNSLAHPTMLARRQALLDAGGYRDVPSEDYDLWIRLLLGGASLRRLAAPVLVYQRGEQQVTASPTWVRSARTDERTAQVHARLLDEALRHDAPGLFAA